MKNKILTFIFYLLISILIIYIFFITALPKSNNTYIAKNGVTDLSHADLTSLTTPINLHGNWNFYYNELISPNNIVNEPETNNIKVPSNWSSSGYKSYGYATYHLKIICKNNNTLALKIPDIGGGSKVFVNNDIVYTSGIVGKDKTTSLTNLHTKIVMVTPKNNTLDLVVWVSNFNYFKSGINFNMQIGTPTTILNKNIEFWVFEGFLLGGMLFTGILNIIIFSFRKNEKTYLYFGLMFIFQFLRYSIGTIQIHTFIFNKLPVYLEIIIPIICLILFIYYSMLFGLSIFKVNYTSLNKLIIFPLTLSIFLCLIAPLVDSNIIYKILQYFPFAFALLWFVYIFKNINNFKGKLALLYSGSLLIYLIFAIIEALSISTFYYPSLSASLVLIFAQSIIISYKYNESIVNVENYNIKLAKEVKEKTIELSTTLQSTDDLINSISHDIRTPLTAVNGYIELIANNYVEDDPKKIYSINAIKRIKQMESLLLDLSLITQISNRKLLIDMSSMNISDFLLELNDSCVVLFQNTNIEWSIENQCVNEYVLVDKVRLVQIMDNLIKNAISFAKSKIIIKAVTIDNCVKFSVIDDGSGIDNDDINYVFNKYYKKRKFGTGLGLFIVKELVTRMNGKVEVTSQKFIKTEFSFTLKLTQ